MRSTWQGLTSSHMAADPERLPSLRGLPQASPSCYRSRFRGRSSVTVSGCAKECICCETYSLKATQEYIGVPFPGLGISTTNGSPNDLLHRRIRGTDRWPCLCSSLKDRMGSEEGIGTYNMALEGTTADMYLEYLWPGSGSLNSTAVTFATVESNCGGSPTPLTSATDGTLRRQGQADNASGLPLT